MSFTNVRLKIIQHFAQSSFTITQKQSTQLADTYLKGTKKWTSIHKFIDMDSTAVGTSESNKLQLRKEMFQSNQTQNQHPRDADTIIHAYK